MPRPPRRPIGWPGGAQRPDQLDPNLSKHPGPGEPLSLEDHDALIAFLKPLTYTRYVAP